MSEYSDKESKICTIIEPIEGGGSSYKEPKIIEDYPMEVLKHVEPVLETIRISSINSLAFISPFDTVPQKISATVTKINDEKHVMMGKGLEAYNSKSEIRSKEEQKKIDMIKKLYGF